MLRKKVFWIQPVVFLLVMVLAASPALAAKNSLRYGDRGDDVKTLQTLLTQAGYFEQKNITSYFGKITEAAVRKYQQDKGLVADGYAGVKTMAKLNSEDQRTEVSGDTTLSRGMKGTAVKELQTRLKELGYFDQDRVTDFYGPVTEAAVKKFQQVCNLKVDGICGPQTRAKLFSTLKSTSLTVGMRGDDVKKLQQALKDLGYYTYGVDGVYGNLTVAAVKSFQQGNGLTADGIAGDQTKAKLYSGSAVSRKDADRSAIEETGGNTGDSTLSASGQQTAQDLIAYAKLYLNKPYRSGGNGPDSFDCTGFTCFVYKHFGISLPRSAYNQGYNNYGIKINNIKDLQPGDLVFFDTVKDSDLSDHAGIYIGNGNFIHCGSGTSGTGPGVKIVTLTSGYYLTNFSWGRRVLH